MTGGLTFGLLTMARITQIRIFREITLAERSALAGILGTNVGMLGYISADSSGTSVTSKILS